MQQIFRLQFLGPLAIFLATLSAEIAARALEYAPSSQFLWFVNLRMFGFLQRSHAALSDYVAVSGFQLFGITLPIFLLACVGLIVRSRFPLALSTHLSAAFAAFVLLSWQTPVPMTQASLKAIAVPAGAGFYVLTGMLGACLLSIALSHLFYLHSVQAER